LSPLDELATVKVQKFDPTADKEPYYKTYKVPYKGLSVLDVIRHIYEDFDPSLAFRFGCAGGGRNRCGACMVLVNNTPTLSCKRIAEAHMTIEAHPKFERIRDLAIDFEKPQGPVASTTIEVNVNIDASKCIACRDCVILCPAKVLEIKKVDGKALAVASDLGSCNGTSCKQCVSACQIDAIHIEASKA